MLDCASPKLMRRVTAHQAPASDYQSLQATGACLAAVQSRHCRTAGWAHDLPHVRTHHRSLDGATPISSRRKRGVPHSIKWQRHCRGLYELPVAAWRGIRIPHVKFTLMLERPSKVPKRRRTRRSLRFERPTFEQTPAARSRRQLRSYFPSKYLTTGGVRIIR